MKNLADQFNTVKAAHEELLSNHTSISEELVLTKATLAERDAQIQTSSADNTELLHSELDRALSEAEEAKLASTRLQEDHDRETAWLRAQHAKELESATSKQVDAMLALREELEESKKKLVLAENEVVLAKKETQQMLEVHAKKQQEVESALRKEIEEAKQDSAVQLQEVRNELDKLKEESAASQAKMSEALASAQAEAAERAQRDSQVPVKEDPGKRASGDHGKDNEDDEDDENDEDDDASTLAIQVEILRGESDRKDEMIRELHIANTKKLSDQEAEHKRAIEALQATNFSLQQQLAER